MILKKKRVALFLATVLMLGTLPSTTVGATTVNNLNSYTSIGFFERFFKGFDINKIINSANQNPIKPQTPSNPQTPVKPQPKFAKTNGKEICIDGTKYTIKGVVANNAVASSPTTYDLDMMTEADYKEISELGFNTVRFLFNYNMLEDDNNPYVYKQSGWDWIDMNLAWANKYNIHIILDYHLTPGGIPSTGGNQGIWGDNNSKQDRIVKMWEAIASKYKDNDTILGYGLVNEPFIETTDKEAWNKLLSKVVEGIRKTDNNHILFIQRAQIGSNKDYVNPTVNDTNWVLEIHKYPNSNMQLTGETKDIPSSYLYYGNDSVVCSVENKDNNPLIKSSLKEVKNNMVSADWQDISFDFTAGDSNYATLVFEALNIADSQSISIKDITVKCDNKEIYNAKYNINNSVYTYNKSNQGEIIYDAKNNNITLNGSIDYLSFKDTGAFRFFRTEPNKQYTVSFKIKSSSNLANSFKLKVSAKEYKASEIQYLNKSYLNSIMDSSELSNTYNVPILYGEVGIPRVVFDSDKNTKQLTQDMVSYLKDNSCNFTWFTWHETYFGVYSNSGLEPKSNKNTTLYDYLRGM